MNLLSKGEGSAVAIANPNIAFIKYWGNRDPVLRLPSNSSISMNLDGLETRTTVTFDSGLSQDELTLNGQPATEETLLRVSSILDRVRAMAGMHDCAQVESRNNFPTGAGIASSASAFAALSLAASAAAGLQLSERECSKLARRGSGSACRSVPGGFVEWQAGNDDGSSFAYSLAPADHWDLVDCVAVVSQAHKPTGSTQGHALADSSALQAARVASAPVRLEACRRAILQRDFSALAAVAELDCNLMHAVMMTSQPPLLYWQPATLAIMQAVQEWRAGGLPAFYSIDAGPNVHVLCPAVNAPEVTAGLYRIDGVKEVLSAGPGGPARLV
jgi:diphosphomevalonate decarboxylase